MLERMPAPWNRVTQPGTTSSTWPYLEKRPFENASFAPPPGPPRPRTALWLRIFLVAFTALRLGLAVYQTKHVLAPRARTRPWEHEGEIAQRDHLVGEGRIYLVQLGEHKAPYTVQDLAEWLRDRYALDVQVLQSMNLDHAAWDSSRHQYIAEKLLDEIKQKHPDLAADPKVWLIGFTDSEMYSATEKYSSTFSQRDHHNAAIISADDMEDSTLQRAERWFTGRQRQSSTALRDRLRRILLKDVAILFWKLPLNNDPGSLLYFSLNPEVPNSELYESDVHPAQSEWGEFIGTPCIVFTYTPRPDQPASATVTTPLIRQCEEPESVFDEQTNLATPHAPPDTTQERMELRLREGLLTEKHTDFYLPGPIPIRFERANSNRWLMPEAFGISGSHNYDRYLYTNDEMRHILISNAGGGDASLERYPSWLPMDFFNRWNDTDLAGAYLNLRLYLLPRQHYELRRYNGEVESYMTCKDGELCLWNGYRNPQGGTLTMDRDAQRRLTRLQASQDNWLRLHYDATAKGQEQNRVTDILDSHRRHVIYSYNSLGQLATVTYPSGEVLRYTYDSSQNLLAVDVAPNATAPATTLINNSYLQGRLVGQTLPDGSSYRYDYLPADGKEATTVIVHSSTGKDQELRFDSAGAALREIDPASPTN